MHADGITLDVVQLPQEQQQFNLDLKLCNANVRSACGPGGSMVSMSTLEGFQPDLSLLAVHGAYQVLQDSIKEDLLFQTQVYGEYLQPGDTPVVVVVDSASNIVQMETLDPAEAEAAMLDPSKKKKMALRETTVFPSAHIADTFRTVRKMSELRLSPDSCVMYIEDRLHELISCARVMMEYLCVLSSVPSREQLEADLHLGPGDLHLIASLLQGSRRWPLA